jgi:hypothetical protein
MAFNRETLKEILSNIAVFSLPLSLISVLYFITYGVAKNLLFALIVPFLLMYVIRKTAAKIYVFIVLHILVVAAAGFIIGDGYSRWFVWFFLALCVLYSCFARGGREAELGRDFIIALVILAFVLPFILRFANTDPNAMHVQLTLTFFVVICVVVAYVHMDNLDYRLLVAKKLYDGDNNAGKILSANNKVFTVFVGVLLLIGIVFTLRERLWQAVVAAGNAVVRATIWLGQSILYFLAAFRQAQERHQGPVLSELENIDEDEYILEELLSEIEEITEIDPIFETVERVYAVFGVLFAILLVAVGCYFFYKLFYKRRKNKNVNSLSEDEIIALERTVMNDLAELLPWYRRKSPMHPLRKLYAKKVNGFIRAGVNVDAGDTTDIIADKVRNAENIDDLTAAYEQIRYGKR